MSSEERDDHVENHANLEYRCPNCRWMFAEYSSFQEHLDCCVVDGKELVFFLQSFFHNLLYLHM